MDERGVDRLFTLPLGEFVAARNALAKSIKASGDKETAARIMKLPKPSISAWAINQLVRREPELIRALLQSLDRQKELQVSGLEGGVDREAMKAAKGSENEAMGRIERALAPILEAGGHASGRSSIERCVKSLRAAAIHPEGRPLLENGHLTIDFDTLGFEALGAVEPTSDAPHLRLVPTPEDKRREKEERLEAMRRQRLEAQAKMEEEQRRFEEKRRKDEARRLEEQALAERRREEQRALAERMKKERDPDRMKETVIDTSDANADRERVKATMLGTGDELKERVTRDVERTKQTASEARPIDPERVKQTVFGAPEEPKSDRLGELTKVLTSLRQEHARIEEQVVALEDQVERARQAYERAQREAARARQDLVHKAEQIAQLEGLLGMFDQGDGGG